MTLDQAFARLRAASETVPTPLRLPTAAEVDAAERDLGRRFHPDYRRFQLEASNIAAGTLEPALVLPDLPPYLDLRTIVQEAREIGVPKEVLPFCEDNGDYYTIDPAGRIALWDHTAGAAIPCRKSLAEWIANDWLDADEDDDDADD